MPGQNIIKLTKALELLAKSAGTTINELARNLGVDRRSAYRMIDLIEEIGVPLYQDKETSGREKRWRLVDEYVKKLPNMTLPSLYLSLSEIVALYLLKGEGRIYKGTEIEKTIESAFRKIEQFAPPKLIPQLAKISSLIVSSKKLAKDYSGKQEIITLLTEAMLQTRTCFVKYHSFSDDRLKNFKIDPLCFFENNGGLYIFVRTTTFDEIRILAVERIEGIESTEAIFVSPTDFDPHALLDSAFDIVYDDPIEVKIWFSADQARYIKERTWAKEQRFLNQSDGSVILEIKTSGRWHVKKWVLSFGVDAELLEPVDLRNEVLEDLNQIERRYRTNI